MSGKKRVKFFDVLWEIVVQKLHVELASDACPYRTTILGCIEADITCFTSSLE